MAHPLIHPRLPGGHKLPDVTRDIGADEYVGPLRRVEFGVLPDTAPDPAYTVVSAFPLGVLTNPVNTVLDDPDDPNDSPSVNPGITVSFDDDTEGARIELYIRDATNHPIEIIAFGADENDPNQDTVLMAQPEFRIDVDPVTQIPSLNVVPRNGSLDLDVLVDWEEEIPEEPDNLEPDTVISAWVSFAMTTPLINAAEETPADSGIYKLGYRSGLSGQSARGIILIDTNAVPGQTGFPYWWANF